MVTMKDIAKHAGVSRTTVSFVLNNSKHAQDISIETKKRVNEAAKELGYRADEIARAMVTGKTRTLGFLSTCPVDESTAGILTGAVREASKLNYSVKMVHVENLQSDYEMVVDSIIRRKLDGLLLIDKHGSNDLKPLGTELSNRNIPIAVIGKALGGHNVIRIDADHKNGAFQVVSHLHGLGHKNIALISSSCSSDLLQECEEGFVTAINALGLSAAKVFALKSMSTGSPSDDAAQLVRQEVNELVSKIASEYSAFYCDSVPLAMLVQAALIESGLSVPGDVSVICHEDSNACKFMTPALTALNWNLDKQGAQAVKHLIDVLESDASKCEQENALELTVRASTAKKA